MLNKYGKFRYAICTFQGVTSHHSIRTETNSLKPTRDYLTYRKYTTQKYMQKRKYLTLNARGSD